ncbi:MAG: type II secretion system protein N [Sphingomonadales bacterium]|jgi:general secretion pathway protein N
MKRALFLGLGALIGGVALAPAALLLPAPPLAAARVSGSVWNAELAGASIGPLLLGDVSLALDPGALLHGRLGWRIGGGITGQIWRGFAAGGAAGLNGRLAGSPLASLPLAGVTLGDASATLDGAGRCTAASGNVVADLAVPLAGQRQLMGAPRCDGDALLLPLASSDGRVRAELTTTRGHWSARIVISGAGSGEAAALIASGFRGQAGALVRQETGSW